MGSDHRLEIDGSPLRPLDVEAVARGGARVRVAGEVWGRIEASRRVVERALSSGVPVYGINTGFGSLARSQIPLPKLRELQLNLVRSHAAGAGRPLPDAIVRAMMLVLCASLCRGRSGVRSEVVRALVALLNAGVVPVVPELGSVGASGDLAPLAHMALVLVGEGRARLDGREMDGAEALARAGVAPLRLEAKEGLALLNGTHLMAGRAALLVGDVERLLHAACAAGAMSLEGCRGTDEAFDPRILAARNHPGPSAVAACLRGLTEGSEILSDHKHDDSRVQDPYSFRCLPQVLGAVHDALDYVRRAVEAELGAVTDNPLIDAAAPEGAILSGGNFHGMPIALPLDVLAIAIAHVAGVAERRIFFLLAARDLESRLPPYLAAEPGLHSGLMIAQYTAAACCNELAGLAAPASVVNLPTSAGTEDYNSFGPRAAAKAERAVELARTVVAVELLCAAAAVDAQRPLRSGVGMERAHALVREVVAPWSADRPPAPDIAAIEARIAAGDFAAPLPSRAGDGS